MKQLKFYHKIGAIAPGMIKINTLQIKSTLQVLVVLIFIYFNLKHFKEMII